MTPVKIGKTDYLVVLTGAGISAESGVRTFRDNNGLWEQHRIEDVATPEAFLENPQMVWRFYDQRRKQLKTVSPNPAHYALAELEKRLGTDRFFLITQNVDDLHERGGSQNLLHLHGELWKIRCSRCRQVTHSEADVFTSDGHGEELPACACGGMLRPHIVWFGEVPFGMDEVETVLARCTHFLSIGTSGVVYPAAGFLYWAKQHGAQTFSINLEAPENNAGFDTFIRGKAGEALPIWVDSLEIED